MSPAKGLRRTSTSEQGGSTLRKRARRLENKPKLLSLNDASLSLIFSHLGACDTGGSFQGPRYAFALAQTNSRLLQIFYSQMTSITPDMSNNNSKTLSESHMLSVLRHTGGSLLELNLPATSCSLLPRLHDLCPRLQRLSICDNDEWSWSDEFSDQLHHSLRSFSVRYPTRELLRLLAPPPEELYLTEVLSADIPELETILGCRLKKLYLRVVTGSDVPYLFDFREYLHEACSKIEDVTVKLISIKDDEACIDNEMLFLEDALAHLTDPCRNKESKCRKMTLEGDVMSLLTQAHPDATLEITRWQQTFAHDGKTIYLKEVPVWDPFLTQDLSRLTAVNVRSSFQDQWKRMLSGLHLERARFESSRSIVALCLNVDIVEISVKGIDEFTMTNWECLRNVREVRLSSFLKLHTNGDEVNIVFFMSLACLLNQFRGKTVWTSHLGIISVTDNFPNRVLISDVVNAVDVFEARGGDAGTVRSMIKGVLWSKP